MTKTRVTCTCTVCGWIFDAGAGDPGRGQPAGIEWEDLAGDWACPVCEAGKEAFTQIEALAPERVRTAGKLPVVIVGSGLAGYTLVQELRKHATDLPVTVLTADGGEVYTKPRLSNALGKGQAPDDLIQKQAADFAREQGITLRTRIRVRAIDPAGDQVVLEDGTTLAYASLVLAVGADPRVFPAAGSELVGIATVNDLDDYRRWRQRIGTRGRILLTGAGLIGCEFANDLAGAGFDVSVLDPAPWPLARLLPQEIGNMLVSALEGVGVKFLPGRTVTRYETAERGFSALLDDGTTLSFDHALSAVGLTPRTALAAGAGIGVKTGILVDRMMRTSHPAIYALGDCAETETGPLPFIAPLLAQARVLAATLVGKPAPLHLPALPVVVKTPALALVVSPPRPGAQGKWVLEREGQGATAIFQEPDGREIGFALAGTATYRLQELARRMPDLLPPERNETAGQQDAGHAGDRICDGCGWVYDPREGDPDGGIPPGTPWEEIPEGWTCPVCGLGKEAFSRAS